MTAPLNPVFNRLVRRLGISVDQGPTTTDSWQTLRDRISLSYDEHQREIYILERSQTLAGEEMGRLNQSLQNEKDALEQRVHERTAALQLSEKRLSSLVCLSADWIWEQDDALRFTYVSDGLQPHGEFSPCHLIGSSLSDGQMLSMEPSEKRKYEDAVALNLPFRDVHVNLALSEQWQRHLSFSGEPVMSEDGVFLGYRGVGRDVTERVEADLSLKRMARYDALTGLMNRNMLISELDKAIDTSGAKGLTLCLINLDEFKVVNDTLGYACGDMLLSMVSKRLRSAATYTGTVARMGADEFMVVIPGAHTAGDRESIIQQLLEAITAPVTLQGCTFDVSACVGVVTHPNDGNDSATLLKHADAALTFAKRQGKSQVQFYTGELVAAAARQMETESELRHAIEHDELLLFYQPKIDVQTGRLQGMEALIRWRHPVRGMVPPVQFIPLAEERGLIVPLGRWVVQEACRQLRAWQDQGLNVPPVAVNVSARQIADDQLVWDIEEAIQRHGVRAQDLEIEITETVLIIDPARAQAVLHRLHGMGLRISLDDFGTGFSSLSHLKNVPAHAVKIDKSFVDGLPHDGNDAAITQAVIGMAHALNMKVVAEGVETQEQLATLGSYGCDEAQGYLLGRPMPASDLLEHLTARTLYPPQPTSSPQISSLHPGVAQ